MKRFWIATLVLLLTLALAGCGEQAPMEAVDRYGNEYTIDREAGTISDGTNTYRYTYKGYSDDYSVSIEYPNGGRYSYSESGGFGSGGGNSQYDPERYVDADILIRLLVEENTVKKSRFGNILAALVLIGGGIFCIACPETVWYLESGWRYRDAEPSDLALGVARISGVAAIVIGLIVMLC